jgi:hypothetical protein
MVGKFDTPVSAMVKVPRDAECGGLLEIRIRGGSDLDWRVVTRAVVVEPSAVETLGFEGCR